MPPVSLPSLVHHPGPVAVQVVALRLEVAAVRDVGRPKVLVALGVNGEVGALVAKDGANDADVVFVVVVIVVVVVAVGGGGARLCVGETLLDRSELLVERRGGVADGFGDRLVDEGLER